MLTVLLLALPWTALGCLDLCGRFAPKISYARAWAGALCFLLLVGSVRAISHRDRGLEREAALGHWLNEHLALDTPIALTKTMPLCAYYGGDARPITWLETRDAGWTGFLATHGLQLAIVEGNTVSHVQLPPDWRVASLDQLPENCRTGNFTVLERVTSPDQTHAARTPGQGTLER